MSAIRTLSSTALLLLAACTFGPADDGGGMTQVEPPSTGIPAGGGGDTGGDTAAPACDGSDLCARSIDECGVTLSQQSCEAWYADPDSCRDMDAYVACNCDCIEEPECDGYFACGEFCYQAHCL